MQEQRFENAALSLSLDNRTRSQVRERGGTTIARLFKTAHANSFRLEIPSIIRPTFSPQDPVIRHFRNVTLWTNKRDDDLETFLLFRNRKRLVSKQSSNVADSDQEGV